MHVEMVKKMIPYIIHQLERKAIFLVVLASLTLLVGFSPDLANGIVFQSSHSNSLSTMAIYDSIIFEKSGVFKFQLEGGYSYGVQVEVVATPTSSVVNSDSFNHSSLMVNYISIRDEFNTFEIETSKPTQVNVDDDVTYIYWLETPYINTSRELTVSITIIEIDADVAGGKIEIIQDPNAGDSSNNPYSLLLTVLFIPALLLVLIGGLAWLRSRSSKHPSRYSLPVTRDGFVGSSAVADPSLVYVRSSTSNLPTTVAACPKCGEPALKTDKFCVKCGAKLWQTK